MMPIPGHAALRRVSPQGWVSLTLKPTGGVPKPLHPAPGLPQAVTGLRRVTFKYLLLWDGFPPPAPG